MGQGSSELRSLENKIGYSFYDKNLLTEAISHDSLRVADRNIRNYQRLEFLGDSVIQLVITDYLYQAYPAENEGQLTQRRINLVNGTKQSQIAEKLQIRTFIKTAPSVDLDRFRSYGKFVEAIIGAVYVDAGMQESGLGKAKNVISKLWALENNTDETDNSDDYYDYDD